MGAILELSKKHSLRVLIPMVTLEGDIRRMREAFDAITRERKISHPPEFGAMVETPAAALAIPALLKYVNFFCVGTNDLTQYTLAAARDDASVNNYYLDSHESVMRLLDIILADAGERPVTLCGELAGREAYVPRLLKMGFRAEHRADGHSHDEGADTRTGYWRGSHKCQLAPRRLPPRARHSSSSCWMLSTHCPGCTPGSGRPTPRAPCARGRSRRHQRR